MPMILPTNLTDRKVHPPKVVYIWFWSDSDAHDPPNKLNLSKGTLAQVGVRLVLVEP